jgi:hypothetical protein
MPTQTKKAASTNGKAKAAPKRAARPKATGPSAVATRAVDVPVGAVLELSDRVAELVGPFTDRAAARKQLKSYRTRVTRSVKRSERRGATVRRKATGEAQRNRTDVEQRVRKSIEEQTSRAQALAAQLPSIR